MSALCLKQKNAVKTEAWSSIFSSFGTETKSCLFMKQLTTTCVSTILYLRKILPDDYFESKNFEGMTLKLLKFRKGHSFVNKIENWLEGAFEAMDKKYLKQLMLDIKDAESKMTLEIYTLSFNYKKGNEELNVLLSKNNLAKENFSGFTISNTKSKTLRLLQMCYAVTQSCRNLPPQITLAIRLSYHENTPGNYQPRGYKAWEPTDPIFPKDTRSIEMGVTDTNHHSFKLISKSCLNDKFFKDIENQGEDTDSAKAKIFGERELDRKVETPDVKRELLFDSFNVNPTTNTTKHLIQQTEEKNPGLYFTQQNTLILPENQAPLFKDIDYNNLGENKIFLSQESSDPSPFENANVNRGTSLQRVRCPCQSTEKSEVMFTCSRCKYLAHAECFGVLEFNSSKKLRFNCHLCHQPEGKPKCHDKVMTSLKHSSDQQKLAILRRILKICNQPCITKITLKKMEKIAGLTCPKNVVQIVLKKIIELGVVMPQKKKKNFLIDKHQLAGKLFHYFYQLQTSRKTEFKPLQVPLNSETSTMNIQHDVNSFKSIQHELSKRKATDCDFFFHNKLRKSTVTPQLMDTQIICENSTQGSYDIFNQ